jgi:hypothetical protein
MPVAQLLTLGEAAAISGLSTSHLALLCRTGKVKAVKKGRDWLTTRRAVAAYLADSAKRSKRPFKNTQRGRVPKVK